MSECPWLCPHSLETGGPGVLVSGAGHTRVRVHSWAHAPPGGPLPDSHTPRLAGLAFTNNHSTPPSLHPLPSTESAWRVMVIAILAGTI